MYQSVLFWWSGCYPFLFAAVSKATSKCSDIPDDHLFIRKPPYEGAAYTVCSSARIDAIVVVLKMTLSTWLCGRQLCRFVSAHLSNVPMSLV